MTPSTAGRAMMRCLARKPYALYYDAPANAGDVLRFNGTARANEFAAYDEFNPLRKILVDNNGEYTDDLVNGVEFLLNFNANEGVVLGAGIFSDGDDVLFGDLGNDWVVGGTGIDHLYGGWGDDLLNADDNHDSTLVDDGVLTVEDLANDLIDEHWSYNDTAFGGAGRDILIANGEGDRLVNWTGNFNIYLTPPAQTGDHTVSRSLQTHLTEYLYDLSEGDGADPTRANDTGSSAERNGEPDGELGLVRQSDFAWHDQTGTPPELLLDAIPGGPREVLRAATFNDGSTAGFAVDSGMFEVLNSRLQVSPAVEGGDAVAVFAIGEALPSYFELLATINAGKPTGGLKSNAFLIFDYQGPENFKFAGVNISTNKLQMGHRDSAGWHVDVQSGAQLKADTDYNILLAINGVTATLVVNNAELFSHTFAPRVEDGVSFGLNAGLVGIGADNSIARIDNVVVQVLPPDITFEDTEDFTDGADLFQVGDPWEIIDDRYVATAALGEVSVNTTVLTVAPSSILELGSTLSTAAVGGIVFDQSGPGQFKFAALSAITGEVLIGHHTTQGGWVVDASAAAGIVAGTDYDLGVSLKGTSVSITLGGQDVLGFAFNSVVVDGEFRILTRDGASSFDTFTIQTNDPALGEGGGASLMASAAPSMPVEGQAALDQDMLAPLVEEAIARWGASGLIDDSALAALEAVTFEVADLDGLILAETVGSTVRIDVDAAGHGWFVDVTPLQDEEFDATSEAGVLVADRQSEANGRMDLLTAISHKLGHAVGFEHGDPADGQTTLMDPTLSAGVRVLSPTAPAGTGNPRYVSSGYTNPDNNLDVDGNGWLTPFDALLVVNALNRNGPRDLSTFEPQADNRVGFIDTSGDSLLSAFDVLLVINALNRLAAAAEGESAAAGLGQPAVASAVESAGSEMSGGSSEIVNASIASAPSLAEVQPTWSRVNEGHQVEPRLEPSGSAPSPVTPMLADEAASFPVSELPSPQEDDTAAVDELTVDELLDLLAEDVRKVWQ